MIVNKKKFHSTIFFNWSGYLNRGFTQGNPIITYYDNNQDSEFDICGIDKDRDGKDDRQMKFETCSLAG